MESQRSVPSGGRWAWGLACLVGVAVWFAVGRAAASEPERRGWSSPASSPGAADTPSGRRAETEGEADRFSGTLRTAFEYDSNVYRQPGDGSEGGVLGRYFLSVEGELPAGRDGELRLELAQGGKWFPNQPGASVLLTQSELEYRRELGAGLYGTFELGMKDRYEERTGADDVPHADYNRGRIGAGLGWRRGRFGAKLAGGWRYFAFRPNPTSSNHGPEFRSGASMRLGEAFRIRAGYTLSRRRFSARRLVDRDQQGGSRVRPDPDGRERRDWLHVLHAGGSYRGTFFASVRYRLLRNVSNSHGQGVTRHGLAVRSTVPLPWRLYASAAVQIRRTQYEDPVFVNADLQVDENNRNSVVVSLARGLSDDFEVSVRYQLFLEEFGAASDYVRQTGSVGIGYLF